jgi:hypothetical protein
VCVCATVSRPSIWSLIEAKYGELGFLLQMSELFLLLFCFRSVGSESW